VQFCLVTRPSCFIFHPLIAVTVLSINQPFVMQSFPGSILGPNTLLSCLFSNTLSLCSYLNLRVPLSHDYKPCQNYCPLRLNLFGFRQQKRKLKYSEQNCSWRTLISCFATSTFCTDYFMLSISKCEVLFLV
jgi:hypothetical protein